MLEPIPGQATAAAVTEDQRTALCAALRQALADDRVSITLEDRLPRARDLWARELIAAADGQAPAHPPDVVVWPVSTAEVQAVVRLCRRFRCPLVPYGAGSGVCGGALARGGVVMDLRRMDRLVEVDAQRRSVTFEAGIAGTVLERELNLKGWTLGHFPSSIMCSTAGGWLATRGAGQCSTRYGKIEDMVRAVEAVTGSGEVLHLSGGAGPDWVQLLVGSEGTLGILTRATCAVRRLPEVRLMRGWMFAGVADGCGAIRELLQAGLRPAVVRLYDEVDTLTSSARRAGPDAAHDERADTELRRELAVLARLGGPPDSAGAAGTVEGSNGADERVFSMDRWLGRLRPVAGQGHRARGARRWLVGQALGQSRTLNRLADRLASRLSGGCLLILGFEGESGTTLAEEQAARELLLRRGGRDLGQGPGEHWLRHRYDVSFRMPAIYAAGAFVDTMEVATTWAGLARLYQAVREAVAPLAIVMAHFSHAYADGCSIYFTFTGASGYDQMWQTALRAVVGAGATISHHHGVGRLKAPFMKDEHGGGMALLRALKRELDPDGILNPGALGLGPEHEMKSEGDGQRHQSPAPRQDPGRDLQQPESWLIVDEVSLLCEVAADRTLGELERRLRAQGLTLGPLPPGSLSRTVGAALSAPRPSEASAGLGRLRDRALRLRVSTAMAPELALPVALAPRRASGPDVKQLFIGGGGRLGAIARVSLPVLRLPQSSGCAGWTFADSGPAIEVLFDALDRPGIVDVHGVSGEVLAGMAAAIGTPLDGGGLVTILVRAEGLSGVVDAELARLSTRAQAAGGRPLPAEMCSFWRSDPMDSINEPNGLKAESNGPEADRRLALWPDQEHGFFAPSPAEVGAAFDRATGRRVLCGAYLHGLALCADGSLPAAPATPSSPFPADRLGQIYRRLADGDALT